MRKREKGFPPQLRPDLSFSSEALLQQAIAGLLSRMPDITDVQILQGSLEVGKDIVFKIRGGFGEEILCACVVKNAKITGDASRPGGARTIYFQAEQAFDTRYTNADGESASVERVYVVTPYDLSPSTVLSISGKLNERSGRVKFIGGSRLFDLFRKYWPNYLADEASLIEQHLRRTRDLFTKQNPLPSLAFQYSLGAVSSKLASVYVTQGFHRELRSYGLGALFTSSLPTPSIFKAKLSKESILKIRKVFARIDYALSFLNEWGLCDPLYDAAQLRRSSDRFFEDLLNEWEKSVPKTKNESLASTTFRPVQLGRAERFGSLLANLITQRRNCLSVLVERLAQLDHTVTTSSLRGIPALSEITYRSACYLNECARAAPEEVFLYSNKYLQISFPKDILEQWNNDLLIVGAPGFGKTSFCKWHALLDAERFSIGESDIIPIYVPLHKFSRQEVISFDDAFLSGLGKSALITKGKVGTGSRIRLYLDGLDEIPMTERRREVVSLARNGVKNHPGSQLVITSRDYISANWLDWAPKLYLSEFTDSEVKEFINKWLGVNTVISKEFQLQLRNLPTLYHLLRTPLLATLVVMVFKQTGRLPESKSRLYEVFIDLLSGGWDMAKGILRGSKYGQRIKVIVLSSLAGKVHTLRRREFYDQDIKNAIETSLLGLSLTDWELLRDELISDGLIGQSGGILYFSHLSFQEFLTAKVFMGSPHPTRSQHALELYLFGDDWWKEVLKFYVSLSSNPNVVTTWLKHQLDNIATQKLERISVSHTLELLGSIVESFPEFPLEELARLMQEIVDYERTLRFLKTVKRGILEKA